MCACPRNSVVAGKGTVPQLTTCGSGRHVELIGDLRKVVGMEGAMSSPRACAQRLETVPCAKHCTDLTS